MQKIFCIIGKSGSGKDAVYKRLIQETSLKPVVYYTTRPKRQNEEHGKDYFFVEPINIEIACNDGKLIESRTFKTVAGDWLYATIDDGQFDDGDCLIIASPEQFFSISEYFKDKKEVVPLFIYIDDGIRLQRLISREMLQVTPNYSEICRRYDADTNDFKCLEGIRRINNYSLTECVEEIKTIIRGEKS